MFNPSQKALKITALLVISLLALSAVAVAIYLDNPTYARITEFLGKIISPGEYTVSLDFDSPQHFTYDVTRINVKTTGAYLAAKNSEADIINLTPLKIEPGSQIVGFQERAVRARGSEITYQITSDYKAWYYFNGKDWVPVGTCEDCSNNEVEINRYIEKFPVKSDGIQIKSFLASKGNSENSIVLKGVDFKISGRQNVLTKTDTEKLLLVREAFASNGQEQDKIQIEVTGKCEAPNAVFIVENKDSGAMPSPSEYRVYRNGSLEKTETFQLAGRDKLTLTIAANGDEIKVETKQYPFASDREDVSQDIVRNCGEEKKMTICHYPPGNHENPQTITISESAWPAHQEHGDTPGACEEKPKSKARIYVDGECRNSKAVFTLSNKSSDGMIKPAEYFIYRNGTLEKTEIFQLAGRATLEVTIDANGDEIKVETQKYPDNPEKKTMSYDKVDKCGGGGDEVGKTKIYIDSECRDLKAVFVLTNRGRDDMAAPGEYSVYRNGVSEKTETFQLASKATLEITIDANGDEIKMETKKYPDDPGKDDLSIEILDECGTGGHKITICHYPPGNTDNPQTIEIDESAWPAHLAHGDAMGACAPRPPVCGNNIKESGEECDDGNLTSGDGCSATCAIEPPPEPYFNLAVCYEGTLGSQSTDGRFGYLAHDLVTGTVQNNTVTNGGALPSGIPLGTNTARVWSTNSYHLNQNNYVWTVKIDGVQKTATIDVLGGANSVVTENNRCPTTPPVCGNNIKESGEECDDGNLTNGDGCSNVCTIERQSFVYAYKIICDQESALPNWGIGGPDIGASTAADFVAASGGHCQLASGWDFQWGPNAQTTNGDFVGPALSSMGWSSFDTSTTETNPASLKINLGDLAGVNMIWLREVLEDGYIPFTAPPKGFQEDNVSAEFYCHTDVLNYDNYDFINGLEAGKSYYCIGFNVLKSPPAPVCGNGIKESGEECDDGNLANGDGCSSLCEVEQICNPEAELVTNGGFEFPVVTNPLQWSIFPDGMSGMGWRVLWKSTQTSYNGYPRPEPALLELQSTYAGWLPREGSQYAELDTDWDGPNGSLNGEPASVKIYQDIVTIPGKTYTVNFSFSPRPGQGANQNILSVGWNETIQDTLSAAGGSNTAWTDHTYYFVASAATTRLDFSDAGIPDSYGPFIDSVSVHCGSPAPVCGNGTVEIGEECDDGNLTSGDGCSATCAIEPPPEPYFNLAVCYEGTLGSQSTDGRFGYLAHDLVTGTVQNNTVTNGGALPSGIPLGTNTARVWSTNSYHLNQNNYVWTVKIDGVQKTATIDVLGGANSVVTENNRCPTTPPVCGNNIKESGEECDDGNLTNGDGCSSSCTIEQRVYLYAHKIICDSENDLPNWGTGGPDITATTAQNFVDSSNGRCYFANGWDFQWGPDGQLLNGDFVGPGPDGTGWNTFNTSSSGATPASAILTAQDLTSSNQLWFREIMQDGYVPFTAPPKGFQEDNVSAEFYCHTDVLNYDNYDFISDVTLGSSYYCIGFNTLGSPAPVCGNGTVEIGEECDDGNLTSGDGCSATCAIEPPPEPYFNLAVCYEGTLGSQSTDGRFGYLAHDLVTGTVQNNTVTNGGALPSGIPLGTNTARVWSTNSYHLNQNNYVWTVKIDGVQKTATIDVLGGANSVVTENNRCPTTPPVCGNNIKESGEECDDGNLTNGDGCSSSCTIEQVWDRSNIEVGGICVEPNVLLTITNTGDPVIGDMNGPSQYRIYRNGTLEQTASFQLAGGQSLPVIFDNPMGDEITIQADQRPGHPTGGYAEASVNFCGKCICKEGISKLTLRYDGTQDGVTIKIYSEMDHSGLIVSFANVQNGDILKINGSGLPGGKLGANTYLEISGSGLPDTVIPTSCAQSIVDKSFDDFYVVNHTDVQTHFCGQIISLGPIANDDNAATPYNTPVAVSILANDRDPDGGGLDLNSVTIDSPPSHGMAVYDPINGTVTYTPNSGFSGLDTFTYTVCDLDDHLCASATVTIGVGQSLFPPVANDDSATTQANTPKVIDILNNDAPFAPAILNPASVIITSSPAHGNFSVDPLTGAVTYTPSNDFTGTDVFFYKVKDSNDLWSNEARVDITIGAPPGTANNDAATACGNTPSTITVVANDSPNFIPPTALSVVVNPIHGSIDSINLALGEIKYIPNVGFFGNDSFRYKVCDSTPFCDEADVSVKMTTCGGPVRLPPIARPDTAATPPNTPVNIDVAANDSDPDGNLDKNSVTLIGPFASHGIVSVIGNGVVTYAPDSGFYGTDSFRYQIFDTTGMSSETTVTVKVLAPPIANDDFSATKPGVPVDIQILNNDNDPDGSLVPSSVIILTPPGHGNVTFNAGASSAKYTPDANFSGTDSFEYKVCDNDGFCDTALVAIGVGSLLPPIAKDDSAATPLDTPVDIQILANDFDLDGFIVPGTAAIVAGQEPKHGLVQIVNGLATYTPSPSFVGIDTLVYQVCDNDGLCATATVTVVVSAPPSLPVCGNGAVETGEECDDANTASGDGCSATCTLESPPPIIIPPLVITPSPLPTPTPGIRIFGQFCGKVYSTSSITFAGSVDLPINNVRYLEYSINNGASWNAITQFTSTGPSTTLFNFSLFDLSAGSYTAVIRATSSAGTVLASQPCSFLVKCNLVIGANQFVLGASQSPMSETGVVQFEVGKTQKFYLEAKCPSTGLIRDVATKKEYPLSYDTALKLWTTGLVFNQPGSQNLEAVIANDLGESVTRQINTVFVSQKYPVSDARTSQAISHSVATIYVKDPATGEFNKWQGSAFQRDNPFAIPQGLSVVLPKGEYYINIAAGGYKSVNSLIARVEQQSVVTANLKLLRRGSIFERLAELVTPGNEVENFVLQVAPLPADSLLPIGKIVPEISAVTKDKRVVDLLRNLGDKPSVVFLYNNWNTEAQEQLDVYKEMLASLQERYRLINLTTLEPFNVNLTQSERGNYFIEFLKPTDRFYENYKVTSLPTFFVLSEQGELLGTIVGSLPKDELLERIGDMVKF